MGQLMTYNRSEGPHVCWRTPLYLEKCFRPSEKTVTYELPGSGCQQAWSYSCAEIGKLDSGQTVVVG